MAADRSTPGSIPQQALRTIVEAVDSWRGQEQAFVVYHDTSPYEVVSVHLTEREAREAAGAGTGQTFYGPVIPAAAASKFKVPPKQIGCVFLTLEQTISAVVIYDDEEREVVRFTVDSLGKKKPPEESDIEAIFLTPSGVDKFVIPYLTRVYGADYAAYRRKEWITD